MSTWGDIRARVASNLGNLDDDDSYTKMLTAVNNLLYMLSRAHTWRELEALVTPSMVASTGTYSFTDLGLILPRQIYSLMLTNGTRREKPKYYTPERWDDEIDPFVPEATTGTPFAWTMWGTDLYFWYFPDDTYLLKIRYRKYPTVMTAIGDTIEFENVDDIIEFGTTALTALAMEELTLASVWSKRANEVMVRFHIEDITKVYLEPGNRSDIQGFGRESSQGAQYWNNPFYRRSP